MSDEYEDDQYDENPEEQSLRPDDSVDAVEDSADASPPGRRMPLWLLLTAGLVLLPSLVTVTGQGAKLLALAHPELSRVSSFEHLSLHWWSPVEFRGLKVRNTRDWSRPAPPLLTAQRVVTRQPLWKIALNLGQGVEVKVVKPEVTLLKSDEGSNLSDALTDLAPSGPSSGSMFPFRADIRDGSIVVATPASPASPADPLAPAEYSFETLASEIRCDVSTLDQSAVPDVSFVATLGSSDKATPVAGTEDWNRKTTVHPQVAARLDDLAADFQPLTLEAPDRTRSDTQTIELQMGSVDGRVRQAVQFAARGLQLDVLEPLIAQLIPGVRCRGLLSVKGEAVLAGREISDGFAMRAAARAADVEWRMSTWSRGERLQMETAAADCAVAAAGDGLIVQTLSLECPFGKLHGDGEIRLPAEQLLQKILKTGDGEDVRRSTAVSEAEAATAGQVNIRGQLDLVALSRMIPETLSLRRGLQLQQGAVEFALRTQTHSSDDGRTGLEWQAVAETSPLIARRDQQMIRWDAPIRLQCSGPLSLTSAGLRSATLSGDFGRLRYRPQGAAAEIQGNLNVDRLWAHLGQFVDGEPPGIHGNLQLAAAIGEWNSNGVSLHNLRLLSDNLRVQSQGIQVHTDRPVLQMLAGQLQMAGNGAAVRSLLRPWMGLDWLDADSDVTLELDASPPRRLTVVGEVRPGAMAARTERPRSAAPSTSASTLRINQARLALDVDTSSRPGEYVIRSGRLSIPGVDARLNGTLEAVNAWMTARLVIDADYDLDMLSRMALNDPQGNIRLSGSNQSRFEVRGAPEFWDGSGPADAEPFEVLGEIVWDSADVHGLHLGPGQAPFQFRGGELRTEPVRCSLNGGQLNAMINYSVRENQIALASGSRVENVEVTEELASRWLGYVTPLLADAAGVRGSVSARTSRFLYDLDQPEYSQVTGTVDIHGITASPGESLTVVLQAIDTLRAGRRTLVRDLTLPQQQVHLEMRDGRIAHDQVLLALSGYQLRTRGAVGLNRQLALTLDVPLERSGEQQTGRSVSVPVQGTVDRPVIDLQRLIQDVGGRRIQDEINEQLDRGINRLFDKL